MFGLLLKTSQVIIFFGILYNEIGFLWFLTFYAIENRILIKEIYLKLLFHNLLI